jgi:hypothetical protein
MDSQAVSQACPLPEAACSINCYVTTQTGHRLQVTIRGHNEQTVLGRMLTLLMDFPAPAEPPQAPARPAEPAVPEGWCRRHDLQMTQQHNAKGAWWSHKIADGWCHGK